MRRDIASCKGCRENGFHFALKRGERNENFISDIGNDNDVCPAIALIDGRPHL